MKFQIGSIPIDTTFTPDKSWRLVKVRSVWGFQLQSALLGLVSLIAVTSLWVVATPLLGVIRTTIFPLPIHVIILFFLGTISVHELIHALLHPKLGMTQDTVIDFWPSRIFLCTLYNGPLGKAHQILILVTPFVTLSLVPLLISVVTQTAPLWLAYVSMLNAFVSCGDMLAAYIISNKIPNGSKVRSRGWETYYTLAR